MSPNPDAWHWVLNFWRSRNPPPKTKRGQQGQNLSGSDFRKKTKFKENVKGKRYTAAKAQPLYSGQKRNCYTAVKSATVIQQSLAGWSQLFYGIAAWRGDPPPLGGSPRQAKPGSCGEGGPLPLRIRNGRGSSRHTALTGGGPPRRTKPASPGEGTPPTGGGPLAKEFLRALSFYWN